MFEAAMMTPPYNYLTDEVIADPKALIGFIKAGAPLETAQRYPALEYVFSYLAALHVRHGDITKAPWAAR